MKLDPEDQDESMVDGRERIVQMSGQRVSCVIAPTCSILPMPTLVDLGKNDHVVSKASARRT